MNWYLKVWRQYADFNGRARRKEYWMSYLFNILIIIAVAMIAALLAAVTGSMEIAGIFTILFILYCFAMFIPTLAVTVRRLHDTGKSGWWIFIFLVPLIGIFWLWILLLTEGERRSNEYGPDPKAENEYNRQDNYGYNRRDNYESTNREPSFDSYNRKATLPVNRTQRTRISIGRDYACDICVDNSFEDVSRNHATLAIEEGVLMFEDNSTNGSSVNGRRVHRSRQVVQRGDRIVLGRNYTLSWDDINRYFPDNNGTRKTNRFR
jgi:uncharacterized membrane protein YhaH (DUF805 family)